MAQSTQFRSDFDLKELPDEGVTAEDVVTRINAISQYLNFFNKQISLRANFNCFIAEVTIPATSQLAVQHFLGVTPKYRILLRQTGNGVITDIPSGWNDKVITLYNNGAVEVKATVMIVRE